MTGWYHPDGERCCDRHRNCCHSRFILVHNHPSGNPDPSEADIRLTWELYSMASSLGLMLVDHVIVGEEGYYSFAENGYCGERRRRIVEALAERKRL
ncbi:MAG: hypothetical protein II520_00220 [Bacilli bacterium]|nr:hypothetical protein [Bacilli bacterium]